MTSRQTSDGFSYASSYQERLKYTLIKSFEGQKCLPPKQRKLTRLKRLIITRISPHIYGFPGCLANDLCRTVPLHGKVWVAREKSVTSRAIFLSVLEIDFSLEGFMQRIWLIRDWNIGRKEENFRGFSSELEVG